VLCQDPPSETPRDNDSFARVKLGGIYLLDLAFQSLPPSTYEPLRRLLLDPVSKSKSKETDPPAPRKLTPWQRSVLGYQFQTLPSRVEQRRLNARRLRELLPDDFLHPEITKDHSCFRYAMLVPPSSRAKLVKRLRRRGIGCSTMYSYTLPDRQNYPNTERAANGMVNLPTHADLNRNHMNRIANGVTDIWEEMDTRKRDLGSSEEPV